MTLFGPAEALAYLGILVAVGLSGRGASGTGAAGFYLGSRSLSTGTACVSLFTSELTFVAFLGLAASSYSGNHTAFQLTLGYLIGRVILAVTLLPAAFNGTQQTAYQRLHMRFGVGIRWVGALLFFIARLARDTLVLAVGCSFVVSLSGWSTYAVLGAVVAVVTAYVGLGGLMAAVRMDVVHATVLAGAGLLVLATTAAEAGGLMTGLSSAAEVDKLVGLSGSFDLSNEATLWAGLVGGAAWSLASHGTDNLMVQRLLATGSVRRAGWAVIGTGILLLVASSIMLTTGTLLWAGYGTEAQDLASVLALFLESPAGSQIRGWITAAGFVALASTLSASAISAGASSVFDFLAPSIDGRSESSATVARVAMVTWAGLLVVGATIVPTTPEAHSRALDVTTVVYAVLLGTFVVSGFRRADPMRGSPGSFLLQRFDIVVAMIVGLGATTWLVTTPAGAVADLAWPWRVPLGATLIIAVGLLTRTLRKAVHDPTH